MPNMASRSFKHFVEQEFGNFPQFLIFAVLEWILIIILFIDGILAFFANEFAKFFGLRIPCLLCTRIDHILVRRRPDFYYNDSVCESHKKQVSHMAYCHVHKKLSDIRRMCEGCLLSFATEREADCDTYKSLVGILHKDLQCFLEDDNINLKLRMDEDFHIESSYYKRCSCCGEPLKVKQDGPKGAMNGFAASASSPQAPFATFRSYSSHNLELPHFHYTELKLVADTGFEAVEDMDISNVLLGGRQGKEDLKAVKVPLRTESEHSNENHRTPMSARGNRFFGIPLTDCSSDSPRWAARASRKPSLDKAEFSSDSVEGNQTSEAEGDSILHHLKRRLDRKSLMALYMELDEERNASAVAANNAMAMITRLQAEKAALQMEALQYIRMMEEQAEYDQEALQVERDLVIMKEEELRALEVELEAYRERYGLLSEYSGSEELDQQADNGVQELTSYSPFSEKSEVINPPMTGTECSSNGVGHEENGVASTGDQSTDYQVGRSSTVSKKRIQVASDVRISSTDHSSKPEDHTENGVSTGSEDRSIASLMPAEVPQNHDNLKVIEDGSRFSKEAAQALDKSTKEEETILTENAHSLGIVGQLADAA